MKCYIATAIANPRADVADLEWTADVVTESDYHERGPHAHSHRTGPHGDVGTAKDMAKEWAEERGYTVVSVDDIA
jgi:hypothetical protein